MDLYREVENFSREIAARNGTPQQALLILFAYATDHANPKPPLEDYITIVLGPRPATSSTKLHGAVPFKILSTRQDGSTSVITIGLETSTRQELDAMLAGQHPLAVIQSDQNFTFESGKELCHLSVYFQDGIMMLLAVARGPDYIGVEYHLIRNGDMLNTSGIAIRRDTILGKYELWANDQPPGGSNPPTHVVVIQDS